MEPPGGAYEAYRRVFLGPSGVQAAPICQHEAPVRRTDGKERQNGGPLRRTTEFGAFALSPLHSGPNLLFSMAFVDLYTSKWGVEG